MKSELFNKPLAELNKELAETREELREVRFKAAEGQLREVHRVRALRAKVAELSAAIAAKQSSPKAA